MNPEFFHRNDYLEWYLPRMSRSDGAINLHASGVVSLGREFARLPDENPWALTARFEAALSEWLGLPTVELLFAPGATGGTLLALLALARPGSEVLVESPIYEPMVRQARRMNSVVRFERRPEEGWYLRAERVAAAITPATSMVMITEPHNPSGRLSPRAEVLAIAQAAAAVGARLLVNEVYRGFAGSPSYHGVADNVVVVSSLAKFLGAYWARLGWLSASPETIAILRSGHTNMGLATAPGAGVGVEVLAAAPALAEAARAGAWAGREVVQRWIDRTPGLSWQRPDGPGFGAVELPPGVDDVALAEELHDRLGVLVVPGSCFQAPGTIRLSWLQAGERLEEGLETVARLVGERTGNSTPSTRASR